RLRQRARPGGVRLIDGYTHADLVDATAGAGRTHKNGHVVMPSLGVEDVSEQPGLAFVRAHAAAELPAHQWMELGILVDRLVDPDQEAGVIEGFDMIPEIAVTTACYADCAAALHRSISVRRYQRRTPRFQVRLARIDRYRFNCKVSADRDRTCG